MESELLPCPFCQIVPISDEDKIGRFRILCASLSCNVDASTVWCNKLKDAVKTWNTRTNKAEQVLAELKEWLESLNDCTPPEFRLVRINNALDKIKELQGE